MVSGQTRLYNPEYPVFLLYIADFPAVAFDLSYTPPNRQTTPLPEFKVDIRFERETTRHMPDYSVETALSFGSASRRFSARLRQ